MNYFTPELLALGLTNDDSTLNEQERLWDEAGARFVAYLDTVRPKMPPGLRKFDADFYLHDALIQGMGQQGRAFVIVVQLDTSPRSLLTLEYDLVEEPIIHRDVLPVALRGQGTSVDWQYDEIEMIGGDPPTWRHSILCSNGWEVRLHFRDLTVREMLALIPASASTSGSVPSLVPSS